MKKRPFRRLVVVSVLILIVVATVLFLQQRAKHDAAFEAPAKRAQHEKVTLALGTWAGYSPAFVAESQGLFKDLDVQITVIDDTAARHAAMQSGALSVMMSTVDQFAIEAAQGIPGSIILVTDESAGGDGLLVRNGIASVKDLAGKRVAYTPGLAGEYLLYHALKANEMSLSDIRPVEIYDPDALVPAFIGSQVDAVVTWEPFLSALPEEGIGRVLITSADLPQSLIGVLVGHPEFAENSDAVASFLDGWFSGLHAIATDKNASLHAVAAGLSVTTDDIGLMLSGLRLIDRATNKRFFHTQASGLSNLDLLVTEAGDYWASCGVLDTPPIRRRFSAAAAEKYFNN